MDNTAMQVWSYNDANIRAVVKGDGELWVVANDVCDYFGETNRNRAMQNLDDDEKGYTQMNTPGGLQELAVVNEAGLYSLLFAMQPQKARGADEEYINERIEKLRAFKRWVTHEVLPSIRKYGYYGKKPLSPKQEKLAAEKAESRAARDAVIQEQKDRMARRREFDKIYPHTYSLLWSVCVADRDLIDKVVKRYAKKINRHILDRFDENSDYQYTDQGIREITEAVWEEQGNGSKIKDLLQSKWYLMKSEKPILKKIWEEYGGGES